MKSHLNLISRIIELNDHRNKEFDVAFEKLIIGVGITGCGFYKESEQVAAAGSIYSVLGGIGGLMKGMYRSR